MNPPSPPDLPKFDWQVNYRFAQSSELQGYIVRQCASRDVALSKFLAWATEHLEAGYVPLIISIVKVK